MIVRGHIKDNQILIDENIQLPDGVQVEIRVPDEAMTQSSGLCGIWKDSREAKEIVEEVISSRTLGRDKKWFHNRLSVIIIQATLTKA